MRAVRALGEAAPAQHGEGGTRGGEHPTKAAAGHRAQERAHREVRATEVPKGGRHGGAKV